ncbi:MAG: hypothetical protein AB7O62_00345 [Pirellulales bacterium]
MTKQQQRNELGAEYRTLAADLAQTTDEQLAREIKARLAEINAELWRLA